MLHTLRLDNYTPIPRKLVLGTNSSFGTESIKIERGAGWDGLNLTATWHIPGREEPLRVALLDGDTMDVPPEVTKEAKDGVLVLAGLAPGVQRASCNVEYLILEQAGVYGGADAEPTPELAEQVLQAVQDARDAAKDADKSATDAKDIAQSVRTDADDGKFNGKDGAKGDKGDDGTTPQLKIGEDNLWHVSYDNGATWVSIGVKATGDTGAAGKDGADGVTPHIGENGNWWIGNTDTGVSAKGKKGDVGPQGPPGEIPEDYPQIRKDVSRLKEDKLDKPANPVVGQVLRVKSISDTGEITLETVSGGLPEGGTAGQVLVKKTDAEGDCTWVDPQTATVRTSMDDVALAGAKYILGEQTALSVTMPTDAQTGQEIMVVFSSGQTACTLAVDLDDFDFVPKANSMCKIVFLCVAADTWLVDAKEG